MKKIHDPAQVQAWLEKENITRYFDTKNLRFYVCQYEKGEYITAPDRRLDEILFLVEGTIGIYGLRSDGTVSPVNQQRAPAFIGDVEFSQPGNSPFFTEALTKVIGIGLSISQYKEQLSRDIRFLHTLLYAYADKLKLFAFVEAPAATMEERVILYMKNVCPSHEICGINGAVMQLRCSRRQLQRVLQKLCADGRIVKIGKGRYKLMIPATSEGDGRPNP